MKTFIHSIWKKSTGSIATGLLAILLTAGMSSGQTLTPEFVTAGYTLTDLGSIDQLPPQNGGLTIRPAEPNTLYIGGSANQANGFLYAVPLLREAVTNHITGFGGPAVEYVATPNIDGGVHFAPNGTLLFSRFSMNELGQILPNSSYVSTPLTQYGVASSVGSLAIVPSGYPGAGNLIFASYNGSVIYHVPYTIDGSGQYILSNQTGDVNVSETAGGPEGIAFIPAGSLAFPNLSMVVSSYGNGSVVAFEVGENGLPLTSTARNMVTGLTGAEGALIDPLTGDFLFSTFGGGNKVIRITGFEKPSAISDHAAADDLRFNVYPNPTKGPVQLILKENFHSGNIEVFNTSGELILQKEISENGITDFDLSALPDGIYLIRAESGDKKGSLRILKE